MKGVVVGLWVLAVALSATAEERLPAGQPQAHFSGFASLALSYDDKATGYYRQARKSDFDRHSVVGGQGDFRLGSQTGLMVQLVARGDERWKPTVAWAMLRHDLGNGFTVRGGRLRMPLFTYSDFLDLGYAQPWAYPPAELYGMVPVTSYEGVDLLYDTILPNGTSLSLQAFAGQTDDEFRFTPELAADFSLRGLWGGVVSWTNDTWTLRANHARARARMRDELAPGFLIDVDENGSFTGIGLGFDNGDWLVVAEANQIRVPSAQYPDTDGAYLTIGRRLGSWTPYLTLARVTTTDDDRRAGAPGLALFNCSRKAAAVGARWDFSPGKALTFDVTHLRIGSGTQGGVVTNIEAMMAGNPPPVSRATVFTVRLDAVF